MGGAVEQNETAATGVEIEMGGGWEELVVRQQIALHRWSCGAIREGNGGGVLPPLEKSRGM